MRSGTAMERFFPLVDGTLFQYATENDRGERGLLLARVSRTSPTRGSLELSASAKHFEYAPGGVRRMSHGKPPVYVLREPLAVGNRWPGESGGLVQIVAIDVVADVPAGRFAGCVKTVEQRGGDRPLRIETTFCPETGIVQMDAAGGAEGERAVLQSYGPPVDIGPPGVRRLP